MARMVAMLPTRAHQLELFVEDVFVNGDAEAAQANPGEIERDVKKNRPKSAASSNEKDDRAATKPKQMSDPPAASRT